MIKSLLIIRLKQIFRSLSGIGLIRLLFLSGLTGFAGIALFLKSSEGSAARWIGAGWLLLLLIIQSGRGDKHFLRSHFSGYRFIFLVEYSLLSVPVLFSFLFHGQWIPAIGLLLGLMAVVHLDLKIGRSNLNTRLQKFIPSDCIEWKAGVRKHFFILITIWIIAAATSFFIGSVPVAIFLLGLVIFSFFEQCEPYPVLLSYELSSQRFLLHKIRRQALLFSVLVAPLIGLYLIFHIELWYIPVAEFFIFVSLHVYVITTKYAFYEPNTKSPAAQTFGSIGILGGIIPVFLPAVWVVTIWFYMKSIKNLDYYLNDYH